MFGKEKIVKEIGIEGMSCMHCAKKVENKLNDLKEVKSVKVNLEKKNAEVILKSEVDNNVLKENVEELGYTVTDIK